MKKQSQYAILSHEKTEELASNFLIPHWSVSGVSQFARNEKSFEKEKIFGMRDEKKGVSLHVGNVYHETLMAFFEEYHDTGRKMGFDELSAILHDNIANIHPKKLKLGKKCPTVEKMQQQILTLGNFAIQSFLEEVDAYLGEIQEIVSVEPSVKTYITLAGYDCPILFNFRPDLIFVDKEGYLCILDHKSVGAYTSEDSLSMKYSYQSIGYSAGCDSIIAEVQANPKKDWDHPVFVNFAKMIKKYPHFCEGVKKFYFYENKTSKNSGVNAGTPQIRHIEFDMEKTRPLYELLLLEQYKAMEKAVSDPDYVYKINTADFFQDGEEILDFWIKSREIENYDEFSGLTENAKNLLMRKKMKSEFVSSTRLLEAMNARKIQRNKKIEEYDKEFLSFSPEFMENLSTAQKIEHRMRCLSFPLAVRHTIVGSAYTSYLLEISGNIPISKIFKHELDIANALDASGVRIARNLQKYKGSSYVSVEVNNEKRGSAIPISEAKTEGTKISLGVDNFGESVFWDYGSPTTPHLLVGGATGSGKTVFERSLIHLFKKSDKNTRVVILDPKGIDFSENDCDEYYSHMDDIEIKLAYLTQEMNRRYSLRDTNGERILIIFDEIADAMIMASDKKMLIENLMSIAQKGRAAKMNLVACTQRASAKIISGDIKVNFSSRVCFSVPSQTDSKVILDQTGAESLSGKGDGLFLSPDSPNPVRFQGFFAK